MSGVSVDSIIKACVDADTFFGGGGFSVSEPKPYASLQDNLVRRLDRGDEPVVVTLDDGDVDGALLSHTYLLAHHGEDRVAPHSISRQEWRSMSLRDALSLCKKPEEPIAVLSAAPPKCAAEFSKLSKLIRQGTEAGSFMHLTSPKFVSTVRQLGSNYPQLCYLSVSSFEPVVWLVSSGKHRLRASASFKPNTPGQFISTFVQTTACVQEPGSIIVLPPHCTYQYFSPHCTVSWASFDSLSPQHQVFTAAIERKSVPTQQLSLQQQNDLLGGMLLRTQDATPPHASAALGADDRRSSRESNDRDRQSNSSRFSDSNSRGPRDTHLAENHSAYRESHSRRGRSRSRSRSPRRESNGDRARDNKDRHADRDKRDRTPETSSSNRRRSPDRRDKESDRAQLTSSSGRKSSSHEHRDDRERDSDRRRSSDKDRHRDDRDHHKDRRDREKERDNHRHKDSSRDRERDRERDRDRDRESHGDRDKESHRDRDRDRERDSRDDKYRDRERDRNDRDQSANRDRERDSRDDKYRDRKGDRDSTWTRDRETERDRDRDRNQKDDHDQRRGRDREDRTESRGRDRSPLWTGGAVSYRSPRKSRSRSRDDRRRSDSRGRTSDRSRPAERDGSVSVEYPESSARVNTEPRTPTYQGPKDGASQVTQAEKDAPEPALNTSAPTTDDRASDTGVHALPDAPTPTQPQSTGAAAVASAAPIAEPGPFDLLSIASAMVSSANTATVATPTKDHIGNVEAESDPSVKNEPTPAESSDSKKRVKAPKKTQATSHVHPEPRTPVVEPAKPKKAKATDTTSSVIISETPTAIDPTATKAKKAAVKKAQSEKVEKKSAKKAAVKKDAVQKDLFPIASSSIDAASSVTKQEPITSAAKKRNIESDISSADDDAMDVDPVSDADSKVSTQSSASTRFSLTVVGAKHAISAPPPFKIAAETIFEEFDYPANPVLTPRFEDEEIEAPPSKRQKLAEKTPSGPLVSLMPISEAPLKVGPFSLFSLIRSTLLEAHLIGLSSETLKQVAAAQPRLHRTIPTNLNMASVINLALNFLLKDPLHQRSWVSCAVAPLDAAYDDSLWKWTAHPPIFRGKEHGGSIAEERELFVMETMFWYCISRGLYNIDEAKRVFACNTSSLSVAIAPYSDSQKSQFRTQERRRLAKFKKAFEYSVTGFPVVSVSRFEKLSNAQKNELLIGDGEDVPMGVFVVDALARTPGGVATVDDVVLRLTDSQFVSADVDTKLLRDTVSSTLAQLSGLVDSPVKPCPELNVWVYRYRERLSDDLKAEKPPMPAEKVTPHLFTSTAIARTVFWNPAGARRSNFAFLPPRRKIGESKAHELVFRLIRQWNRAPDDVDAAALRKRGGKSSPVKKEPAKKPKKQKRQDPIPKHLRFSSGERRGSTSPTKRPGQTDREYLKELQRTAKERQRQEKNGQMSVSEPDPLALEHSGTTAMADLSGIVSPVAASELANVDVATDVTEKASTRPTTRNSIYFEGCPKRLVVRSSDTDPCFLPDTSRLPLEIEQLRQEWPLAAFGAATDADLLLSHCDSVMMQFSGSLRDTRSLFQRSSLRHSSKSARSPSIPWWATTESPSALPAVLPTDDEEWMRFTPPTAEASSSRTPFELFDLESYPDLEWFHKDNPLTSVPAADVSVLRLVELPACVGYTHWLAHLDEAVEEYMSYRDWRPQPGTAGRNTKIATDSAQIREALAYVDRMHGYEKRSRSVLPCNSFEAHHVRKRWSLFASPSYSKILLPLPSLVVEFSRQRLPQGLWVPAELDFIYSVPASEDLEEEATIGKKRKREASSEIKSEASSTSKKKTPKKTASSTSEEESDGSDESDYEKKRKKQKQVPGKKRKRVDSDSEGTSNPYVLGIANPSKPTSRSRRGQALIDGPETAPDSCCRVVLARFSGKPLWPACILTRTALKMKGFHAGYGGGEYLWPFSGGSHFENTHIFTTFSSIDYFVDAAKLQALLDGKMPDEKLFRESDMDKARAFLKENKKLWHAALQTAKSFLEANYGLMDELAQVPENAARLGHYPRQIPGVPQVEPEAGGESQPSVAAEKSQTKPKSAAPAAKKRKVADAPN